MGSDISIEEVGKYTDLFLGPRGPISPGISPRKKKMDVRRLQLWGRLGQKPR